MKKLELSLEVNLVLLPPEEALHRAFKFAEFDVTEMSVSSRTVAICVRA